MKAEKNVNVGASKGLKEVIQPSPLQVYNPRSGRRFRFQKRKSNSQGKTGGSSGKSQIEGKRKSGPGNQGRPEQFGGSEQARRNFEQWLLCNKCKRRPLGDCNDSPRCYYYGRAGHIARDYQNYQNCGKPSHLTKDCLDCYNCGKPGYFAQDCQEQERSNPKQGNARMYALTQGRLRQALLNCDQSRVTTKREL